MKSNDIKAVKSADQNIVKIMSGRALLWEKEKVFNITWSKMSRGFAVAGGNLSDSAYTSYEIRNGKFYGAGAITEDIGKKTYYDVVNGSDTIKKIVYVKSEYIFFNDKEYENLHYDVYVGNLEWKYVV